MCTEQSGWTHSTVLMHADTVLISQNHMTDIINTKARDLMQPWKKAVKGVDEGRSTGASTALRNHSGAPGAGAHTQWGRSVALGRGLTASETLNLQSLQNHHTVNISHIRCQTHELMLSRLSGWVSQAAFA